MVKTNVIIWVTLWIQGLFNSAKELNFHWLLVMVVVIVVKNVVHGIDYFD